MPKNFGIEGIYTEVDGQPTKWLGFTGGVRFDDNSVLDKNVSPRAALFISQPEKYGLKLLYAEGFRNPSAYEAFFFDNVSFAQPVNIHAEKIQSLEAVLWAKPIGGMSLRLSGFYWDATGIVEQLPDPDNMTLLQFQNAGQYISEGIEAEGSYRTSGGWYAFGGGDVRELSARAIRARPSCSVTSSTRRRSPHPAASRRRSCSASATCRRSSITSARARRARSAPTPTATSIPGPTSPARSGSTRRCTPDIPLRFGNRVSYFDFTAGVRNLIGTRDLVPAPQDYDWTDPSYDDDDRRAATSRAKVASSSRRWAMRTSALIVMLAIAAPAFAQRPNQGEDESATFVEEGRAALRRGDLRRRGEGTRSGDHAQSAPRRGVRVALGSVRGEAISTRTASRCCARRRRSRRPIPAVLTALGSQLVLSGDPNDGVPLLEQVVAKEPTRYDAQVLLGHHWHDVGRWQDAVTALEAYFTSRPAALAGEDAKNRVELADSYLRARQAQKALALFEQAAANSSGAIQLRARLGAAWATAAIDCKRARPLLAQLDSVAPSHPEIRLVDGQCALSLGDAAGALALGRRFIDCGPKNVAAGHALVGEAQAARGNLVEARKELETARALEPQRRDGPCGSRRCCAAPVTSPRRPRRWPSWPARDAERRSGMVGRSRRRSARAKRRGRRREDARAGERRARD